MVAAMTKKPSLPPALFTRSVSAAGLSALAAALMLASASPAAAWIDDDDDHIAAREALRRGEILPLTRILQISLARVPGDVIEVDLDREDDGWEYEIKILTSTGRVREVTLDARTGRIIKIEDD